MEVPPDEWIDWAEASFRRLGRWFNKEDCMAGEKFARPLGKRVVVERESADKVTAGGIVIPDTCQERSKVAKVVSLGTGVDLPISEGSRVLYSAYAGTEVKINDSELLVLDASDLICAIEER